MADSALLHLPAAILRLWEERGRHESLDYLKSICSGIAGVHWPGQSLCAITPEAGNGGVFDLAAELAHRVLTRALRPGSAGPGVKILIVPGQARVRDDQADLLTDPLLEDLELGPPNLETGKLHLSTYATARMERRHSLRSSGFYLSPRGLRIPLAQSLGEDLSSPPFRNAEVLRRRPAYIKRPEIDSALTAPTRWLLVTGALGTGKSRAVFEALSAGGQLVVWVHVPPSRQTAVPFAELACQRITAAAAALNLTLPGLSHATGIAGQEEPGALALRSPNLLGELGTAAGCVPTLVVDDLECATAETLWQLEPLLESVRGTAPFRLIAIGRPGSPWPRGWPLPPTVEVARLATAALEHSLAPLASALSMPAPIQQRLLGLADGNPFALEEGLSALVHQRLIRQVYGSFFWSGGATEACTPSDRWIQHVESEARRIGWPLASRLLAVSETAVPVAVLAAAAADLGEVPVPNWQLSTAAGGWVKQAGSAWGPGVTLACPAAAAALASTLSEDTTIALRQSLGRALPMEEERTAWQRYRLLATAPEALPILIEAMEKRQAPPEEAYTALAAELEGLRQRRPNDHLELLLLWHLLPLARRLGKLRQHLPDLARARELAKNEPKRALALAGLAADQAEAEGRLAEAEHIIRETLVGASSQDEQTGALLVLRLGRLLIRQERFQEARELLERVLPLFKTAGAQVLEASCLFYLGNVAIHQHRFDTALYCHREALRLRRKSDKPKALGASLSALGRIALLQGHYPEALSHYREAEGLFVANGEKTELAFALLGIGKALSRLGDYASASTPLRQALALREEAEDQAGEALARLAVAENYFQLQRIDEALREARRSLFDLRMLTSLNAATGDAERLMGRILLSKRQLAEAMRCFGSACQAHQRSGDPQALVLDQATWMEAAMVGNNLDHAEHLATELESALARDLFLENREILEFRLYQGLTWLAERQLRPRGALEHLRLAYRALLAKADHLLPAQRHAFLFQVREHMEIVEAATQEGLAWQAAPKPIPESPATVPMEPLA